MIQISLKVIIFWALISNSCFAQLVPHPFIPKEGRLLIIGQQKDTIDAYIKAIGIVPGGVMVYTSIQKMDGLDKPADYGAGIHYAQDYLNHYHPIVIQLALYMVGALDDTLKGRYDDHILKLAKWMKAVKCPIYFRIGYEFDFPQNSYDPQKYQQVYRYIVDHLRADGVDNVAYVWHSACLLESKGNFMDWYPGDNYVDWFAVSLFNPMQIAIAKNFFIIAREHKKQVMIAESAPAGIFSSNVRREWFRHYFDFIKNDDVRIISYINSYWDSYPFFKSMHWGDSRIQNDPEIKEMWTKEIAKGYLQSSPDLFKRLTGQ
jgi:hypothetical protein